MAVPPSIHWYEANRLVADSNRSAPALTLEGPLMRGGGSVAATGTAMLEVALHEPELGTVTVTVTSLLPFGANTTALDANPFVIVAFAALQAQAEQLGPAP